MRRIAPTGSQSTLTCRRIPLREPTPLPADVEDYMFGFERPTAAGAAAAAIAGTSATMEGLPVASGYSTAPYSLSDWQTSPQMQQAVAAAPEAPLWSSAADAPPPPPPPRRSAVDARLDEMFASFQSHAVLSAGQRLTGGYGSAAADTVADVPPNGATDSSSNAGAAARSSQQAFGSLYDNSSSCDEDALLADGVSVQRSSYNSGSGAVSFANVLPPVQHSTGPLEFSDAY